MINDFKFDDDKTDSVLCEIHGDTPSVSFWINNKLEARYCSKCIVDLISKNINNFNNITRL